MSDVVVDACCLINFCAAERLERWLPSLGLTWYLPRAVRSEALFLRGTSGDEGDPVDEPIDLAPWLESGVLRECDADGDEELALYVELAAHLDDGEALALAIAQHRGWTLATDDRRARRIASERGVSLLSTPEVMKRWADNTDAPSREVAARIQRVVARARFIPARSAPLHDWWMTFLRMPLDE